MNFESRIPARRPRAARRDRTVERGLDELTASREDFAPQRLAELWQALARGECPDEPIDCGV